MRGRYAGLALLWCLVALALKPFFPYLDFAVFYATGIDFILDGRLLDIYSFTAHPPGSELAIPISHPPHYFFFLAPLYALGRLLGISDFHHAAGFSLGQSWILLATLPFDILLCREAVRLVERRQGRLPEPRRLVFFTCLLCSPLLWLSSVRFGHNEALMVAMVLMAVSAGERERPGLAGLFWGLALSVKTTAAAPALVWFGWALGRDRRRDAVTAAAAAAAVFALPLLPYLALRFEHTWYALVGFEMIRPVGGYVLWKLAPFPGRLVGASGALILIGSLAMGLMLARRGSGAPESGRRSFLQAGGARGLLHSQLLLLLLGKAVYVWYGLAAGVFCFLAFPPRRSGTAGAGLGLPVTALGANLLLWLFQSGPWVGEAMTPAVKIRSALWVALLAGIWICSLRTTDCGDRTEVGRIRKNRADTDDRPRES